MSVELILIPTSPSTKSALNLEISHGLGQFARITCLDIVPGTIDVFDLSSGSDDDFNIIACIWATDPRFLI